jgi:hypothetical protein
MTSSGTVCAKGFLAMFLISQAKTGLSALALKRQLGVSYPAAWQLHHKINLSMTQQDDTECLGGLVQLDDACLGGERAGGKVGRGSKLRDMPEFKWVSTVLGNLKTTLAGAFHAPLLRKYAQPCLSAFAYRFNRRFELRGLVAQIITHVARSPSVTQKCIRGDAEVACYSGFTVLPLSVQLPELLPQTVPPHPPH